MRYTPLRPSFAVYRYDHAKRGRRTLRTNYTQVSSKILQICVSGTNEGGVKLNSGTSLPPAMRCHQNDVAKLSISGGRDVTAHIFCLEEKDEIKLPPLGLRCFPNQMSVSSLDVGTPPRVPRPSIAFGKQAPLLAGGCYS